MMAQGQQERDTAEIQLHSNLTTPYLVPTACFVLSFTCTERTLKGTTQMITVFNPLTPRSNL